MPLVFVVAHALLGDSTIHVCSPCPQSLAQAWHLGEGICPSSLIERQFLVKLCTNSPRSQQQFAPILWMWKLTTG